MKTHSRCGYCRARRKLAKHPMEYMVQPRCSCGARNWIKDEYRHRVELPQIRGKQGRYRACYCDGLIQFTNAHPHRIGCTQCCYRPDGSAKTQQQMQSDLARLSGQENQHNSYQQ